MWPAWRLSVYFLFKNLYLGHFQKVCFVDGMGWGGEIKHENEVTTKYFYVLGLNLGTKWFDNIKTRSS